jgi:hypothetical protein
MALREPTMTSEIKEAFATFCVTISTEAAPPSYNYIMNENNRLKASTKLIVEWMKATIIEEAAHREPSRISSRNIFGMSGNASAKEGDFKLKTRGDEKHVVTLASASKKEQARLKKAQK